MIKVEGVSKSYRKKQILSDISFEAKAGMTTKEIAEFIRKEEEEEHG